MPLKPIHPEDVRIANQFIQRYYESLNVVQDDSNWVNEVDSDDHPDDDYDSDFTHMEADTSESDEPFFEIFSPDAPHNDSNQEEGLLITSPFGITLQRITNDSSSDADDPICIRDLLNKHLGEDAFDLLYVSGEPVNDQIGAQAIPHPLTSMAMDLNFEGITKAANAASFLANDVAILFDLEQRTSDEGEFKDSDGDEVIYFNYCALLEDISNPDRVMLVATRYHYNHGSGLPLTAMDYYIHPKATSGIKHAMAMAGAELQFSKAMALDSICFIQEFLIETLNQKDIIDPLKLLSSGVDKLPSPFQSIMQAHNIETFKGDPIKVDFKTLYEVNHIESVFWSVSLNNPFKVEDATISFKTIEGYIIECAIDDLLRNSVQDDGRVKHAKDFNAYQGSKNFPQLYFYIQQKIKHEGLTIGQVNLKSIMENQLTPAQQAIKP